MRVLLLLAVLAAVLVAGSTNADARTIVHVELLDGSVVVQGGIENHYCGEAKVMVQVGARNYRCTTERVPLVSNR